MVILKVSQFCEPSLRSMTWTEFLKSKDIPVSLSTDGKSCLWVETPEVVEDPTQEPFIGDVWFKEGDNDTIEVLKANYDSSD